jgi:hypothetical protein
MLVMEVGMNEAEGRNKLQRVRVAVTRRAMSERGPQAAPQGRRRAPRAKPRRLTGGDG